MPPSDTWPFILQRLKNGKEWKLVNQYGVVLSIDNRAYRVIIPAGFIFDFASVPRIFWWFASPATGLHTRAALIHDWLYINQYIHIGSDAFPTKISRQFADHVFYEVMRMDGVYWTKAQLMHSSVRVGGGFRTGLHAEWDKVV